MSKELSAPYDFTSFEQVMLALDPQRGVVNRGNVITAWIKAGADGKDMRNSALASFLATKKVFGDDKALQLSGGNNVLAKANEEAARKKMTPAQAGQIFLAEKAREPGVYKLPSGMLFTFVKKGAGDKSPTLNDPCDVHYTGTLISGVKFDSSVDRGQPSTFAPSQVIKGWTEALQLMREGDKFRVYIPSNLAYGDGGSPPQIPGGATLIFDMELIKVKSGGKAAADCDAALTKLFGKPAAEL